VPRHGIEFPRSRATWRQRRETCWALRYSSEGAPAASSPPRTPTAAACNPATRPSSCCATRTASSSRSRLPILPGAVARYPRATAITVRSCGTCSSSRLRAAEPAVAHERPALARHAGRLSSAPLLGELTDVVIRPDDRAGSRTLSSPKHDDPARRAWCRATLRTRRPTRRCLRCTRHEAEPARSSATWRFLRPASSRRRTPIGLLPSGRARMPYYAAKKTGMGDLTSGLRRTYQELRPRANCEVEIRRTSLGDVERLPCARPDLGFRRRGDPQSPTRARGSGTCGGAGRPIHDRPVGRGGRPTRSLA